MSGRQGNVAGQGRDDRLIQERIHDPYRMRGKPPEPTLCPECGVMFRDGHWQWPAEPPREADHALCPACRRIRDRVPAGILSLSGPFFREHREDVMNLVRNKVHQEKTRNPMKRLMDIRDDNGGVVAYFTDDHLPRGVGDAVASAYEGELDVHFTDEAGIVRAYWYR